jgi:hypothetical protein
MRTIREGDGIVVTFTAMEVALMVNSMWVQHTKGLCSVAASMSLADPEAATAYIAKVGADKGNPLDEKGVAELAHGWSEVIEVFTKPEHALVIPGTTAVADGGVSIPLNALQAYSLSNHANEQLDTTTRHWNKDGVEFFRDLRVMPFMLFSDEELARGVMTADDDRPLEEVVAALGDVRHLVITAEALRRRQGTTEEQFARDVLGGEMPA